MSARVIVPCICVLASGLLVAAQAGATPPLPGERIAANVTAAGLDVSGLTVDEAAARLDGAFGERLRQGAVTVRAADINWRLTGAGAQVRLDTETSVKRAVYAGREHRGARVDVPLAVTYAQSAVNAFTNRIRKRLHRQARDSQVRITVRRVRVTHSKRGRDINRTDLRQKIGAALSDPHSDRLIRPRLQSPRPKIDAGKARASAATVVTVERRTFTARLFKNLKVVKTYRVAVGKPQYPTPRGRFTVTSKQVNPVWSVPNSPWAGELAGSTVAGGTAANPLKARWMGLAGGIGFHGTGESGSIGTRASHGCIRMHVPDVIALYERVPVGTPVLIS
ncbi:MAG: L,D-transpeptidase [Solirubrobacteraceae bacterium]|nr:L,D-transpeptidase [Solirubrobacteraceae bacterium]